MRIGIVSEGPADTAVITNILKGVTGMDTNDIVPIQPRLKYDKTHLAHLDATSFSNWSLVRQECMERKKIEEFLSLEDSTHVVIHIDASEASLYEIEIPPKDYHQYCTTLRQAVVDKIKSWLDHNFSEIILHAVAIEETDAWVLAIFETRTSCEVANPKKRLQFILSKKGENTTSDYANYLRLSKPFTKEKEIIKRMDYNCSLRSFYEEVKQMMDKENDENESKFEP